MYEWWFTFLGSNQYFRFILKSILWCHRIKSLASRQTGCFKWLRKDHPLHVLTLIPRRWFCYLYPKYKYQRPGNLNVILYWLMSVIILRVLWFIFKVSFLCFGWLTSKYLHLNVRFHDSTCLTVGMAGLASDNCHLILKVMTSGVIISPQPEHPPPEKTTCFRDASWVNTVVCAGSRVKSTWNEVKVTWLATG